jgi:type VI secretion system protein ImpF
LPVAVRIARAMAELSLKERLQPALLDRLIDDERHVVIYRITVKKEDLQRLGLPAADLLAIFRAQGLRPQDNGTETDETHTWQLIALSSAAGPAQLRSFVIKPPGAPAGVTLQSFCSIESRTTLNPNLEPSARQIISMRKLRECVQRDLGWLLNTSNLAVTQDLSRYPHVERSVVNYGMPSLAGRMVTSVDPKIIAQRIRDAITTFEPRLQRVQVSPEKFEHPDEMTLSFRIEAELWGQPLPQHLVLRTSIDIDTGDVKVAEAS